MQQLKAFRFWQPLDNHGELLQSLRTKRSMAVPIYREHSISSAGCNGGVSDNRTQMTPFPKADIWSRLTTWKFPLIQLIAQSPRPPIDLLTQTLTVLHLVSDPIGSIEHLMYKLEGCQYRAVYWQEQIRLRDKTLNNLVLESHEKEERKTWWTSLALISESYSELGHALGKNAEKQLLSMFDPQGRIPHDQEQMRNDFLTACSITGGALGADRATAFGPIIVAEILFIAVFFIDIIRLQSSEQQRLSGTAHVNIEMHSIGFSALFFWVIPTVLTAARIGTSQTAKAIPRILMRFRRDLKQADVHIRLPVLDVKSCTSQARWLTGMYSWQPLQQKQLDQVRRFCRLERFFLQDQSGSWLWLRRSFLVIWPAIYFLLPSLILLGAIATGVLISVFVPPYGWMCRTNGEIIFLGAWFASFLISKVIPCFPQRAWFGLMFWKDALVTAGTIAWIGVTQAGIYNKPQCYMNGDETGLVLPEQPNTYEKLQSGLRTGGAYVTILVLGFLFQLIIVPGLMYARYNSAVSTLRQSDKSASDISDLDHDVNDRNVSSSPGTLAPGHASESTALLLANVGDTDASSVQQNFCPGETPDEDENDSTGTEMRTLRSAGVKPGLGHR